MGKRAGPSAEGRKEAGWAPDGHVNKGQGRKAAWQVRRPGTTQLGQITSARGQTQGDTILWVVHCGVGSSIARDRWRMLRLRWAGARASAGWATREPLARGARRSGTDIIRKVAAVVGQPIKLLAASDTPAGRWVSWPAWGRAGAAAPARAPAQHPPPCTRQQGRERVGTSRLHSRTPTMLRHGACVKLSTCRLCSQGKPAQQAAGRRPGCCGARRCAAPT